eukprot:g13361.t1 g13361   contig8:488391-489443(-)
MHFFCFAEVPYHRSKGRPPSKRKESRLRRRYRARHQYHPPRVRKKKKWKTPPSPSASIALDPPLSCHYVWLFKIFKIFASIEILVRRALVVLAPRVLASCIAYRASALHDAVEHLVHSHRAFVSTFEAMEAPLQRKKEQLRFRPALNATFLREDAATFLREQPDEAEFVAEETLLEKATQQPDPNADDDTVQISNTAPKEHEQQTIGCLTFDPAPRGAT